MKRLAARLALALLALPLEASPSEPLAPTPLPTDIWGPTSYEATFYLNEVGDIGGQAEDRLTFLSQDGQRFQGEAHCTPWAMNALGQVAGICSSGLKAFVWGPGKSLIWIDPALARIGGNSGTRAINNRGEVVGSFQLLGEGLRAFYWSEESGPLDLGPGFFEDINDRGVAVGLRYAGTDPEGAPFVWSRESGPRNLPLPEGAVAAIPHWVNNRGQILGSAGPLDSEGWRPAFWDADGWVAFLPTLGGSYIEVVDLNERGQVLGWSDTASNERHLFLWSRGEGMTDLSGLSGIDGLARPRDLNNHGEAVADCWIDGSPRACYWDGSAVVALGGLPGEVESGALAINDSGLILGWSDGPGGGQFRGVTWQIPNHPQGPARGTWGANRPPVLGGVGGQQGQEGVTLAFTVTASDPDGDPVTLSAAGLPPGARFDAATGVFRWTPVEGQAGSYPVVFTAADAGLPPLSAEAAASLVVVSAEDGDSRGTGCFVVAAGGSSWGLLLLAAGALLAATSRRGSR